jgi:hypothetical protein
LDLYLAKTGYQAQQQEDAADPNRPDDLWAPVGGDPGAHGSFDDRAHSRSWALKLTKNRGWLAASGIVLGAVTAFRKNGRSNRKRGHLRFDRH